ncbi:hypothetical protein SDC9_71076 [bioreactor metagenome]|uniref:Uncharacterized protein n=1 Tax=bioreactor metagenome TaxID=1076179 RepID=A0A644YDI9_9ZZZZ
MFAHPLDADYKRIRGVGSVVAVRCENADALAFHEISARGAVHRRQPVEPVEHRFEFRRTVPGVDWGGKHD